MSINNTASVAMALEQTIHMVGGHGDTSYAANSKLQEKAILETKQALVSAVEGIYTVQDPPPQRLTIADLGCSSGPNAFLVLSEVIAAVAKLCQRLGISPVPELQLFLNDLPGNDFNSLFLSFDRLEAQLKEDIADPTMEMPPHYVAGLPGSFYSRLFPAETVHLFTSSYSLMWLSKMPEGLKRNGVYLNSGNINVGRSSSQMVVKLFQEQFKKDFSTFLDLRATELVSGGHMVLTFLGRKTTNVLRGELSLMWDLLADALRAMVTEGLVEKEKLDTFGIPTHAPTMDEVKALIMENKRLELREIALFESNWDCFDDSSGDQPVRDPIRSGENVAKTTRAVSESLLASHFGEGIVEDLFGRFARNVADHLSKERTNFVVMLLILKKCMT